MVLPFAFGWRHLLFANWAVDAALLETHLPNALSVQEYDGDGWLSVVPFVNVRIRPRGLPARLGVRLPELNLRTYVTCDGEPGSTSSASTPTVSPGSSVRACCTTSPTTTPGCDWSGTTDAGGCALRAVGCTPATDRRDSRPPTGPTANRSHPIPGCVWPF